MSTVAFCGNRYFLVSQRAQEVLVVGSDGTAVEECSFDQEEIFSQFKRR